MKCTINDLNLSFDKEGRLRKTIMRVSKTDSNKATALAGFLVNADFKKFLLENITDDDVLQGETISFNLFNICVMIGCLTTSSSVNSNVPT